MDPVTLWILGGVGAVAALILTGLAWLVKDWFRVKADEKQKDARITEVEETNARLVREIEAKDAIQENRPVTDSDLSDRL